MTEAISHGGGSGDVTGPASSTDNAIARYDGTTGKLLQNSGVTIDDSDDLNIGAHLIKTTNLVIKEGASDAFYLRNSLDNSWRSVSVDDLWIYGDIRFSSNAQFIATPSVDNTYTLLEARDNGVGFVEVARLQSAADPYFSMGGSQEAKVYYSGYFTLNGDFHILGQKELRFYEGANYVGFEAPALGANQIWVLPTADGNNGDFIKTDGAGNLSFAAAAGGGDMVAATYDPQSIAADAFDTDQHTDGVTNGVYSLAERTKLAAIEASATADQTGAEIKAAYEAEADTNAYDDAAVAKLAGIAAGADVTGANAPQAHASLHTNGTDDIQTASTTQKGVVAELATAAETTTGTDATRAVTPDGLAGSDYGKKPIFVKLIDDATALGTGDGKFIFVVPALINGWNLVAVEAHVTTVSSSGTPTYSIYNLTDSADMLSTSITIDANEYTSEHAATPAVINGATDDVATGDRIEINKDVAGTGEKGDEVLLVFQLP